jgi:ribulose-phosphate 3-epimerase
MGANRVSVHYEACPYPRRTLRMIAELGMTAGLAFNPISPIPDLRYLEPYLSFLVLLISEPEIPDAPYLPRMLEKLRAGKAQSGLKDAEWVLDGGVGQGNIKEVRQAGADTVVIGRSLFQGDNIRENVQALRALATA